jgi:hypothetical protein
VKKIADIEENYNEEYDQFRKAKLDPSQIDKLISEASPEARDTLLIIFARSSYLAPKLNNLFDLTLEEKKSLYTQINAFAVDVKKHLTKLTIEAKKEGLKC